LTAQKFNSNTVWFNFQTYINTVLSLLSLNWYYVYILYLKQYATLYHLRYIYNFTKKICTPTYYTQCCDFGKYPPWRFNPIFSTLTSHFVVFFSIEMIVLNGKACVTLFTTVFQVYCCSTSLLLISIITVVLKLYYCSTALLLFSSFTAVLQLYSCSLALLLFYSFTNVLQLYCCSPALLLFPSFTVVL
jgi:hypothetical protein